MSITRAPRRALATLVVTLLAGSTIVLLAPAALAQVNLEEVADAVTEVVAEAAEVAEADQTFDGSSEPTSGSDRSEAAEEDEQLTLTEIIEDTLRSASHQASETVDKVKQAGVPMIDKLTEGTLGGQPRDDSFRGSGVTKTLEPPVRSTNPRRGPAVKGSHVVSPRNTQVVASDRPSTGAPILESAPVRLPGNGLDEIVRQAVEATKKLAFPLLLTLIVVGFLMLQGRVDRSDPKLAHAPLDSEHDLLSFK